MEKTAGGVCENCTSENPPESFEERREREAREDAAVENLHDGEGDEEHSEVPGEPDQG